MNLTQMLYNVTFQTTFYDKAFSKLDYESYT